VRLVLDELGAQELTALSRAVEEYRQHCSARGELVQQFAALDLQCKLEQAMEDGLRGQRTRREVRLN